MKIVLVFFLFFSVTSFTQDLTVPDEILEKLTTEVVMTETDTFTFRVAYPENYSEEKEYECMIGLSGGNQSMEIVNYCYAGWFQSGYFNQHITILPVNTDGGDTTTFLDYGEKRLEMMMTAIQEFFKVRERWIIVGTSNGGRAAFNMVKLNPLLFKAVIVVPGFIEEDQVIDESWKHLDVILAYGEKDHPDWIKKSKLTAKRLKNKVKSVQKVVLEDQGHILPISFNVDRFYDPYFLKER